MLQKILNGLAFVVIFIIRLIALPILWIFYPKESWEGFKKFVKNIFKR